MRHLEDAVAGLVIDVAARSHADTADLGGQHVGNVIAVEVQRGDDAEFLRVGDCILQESVAGDARHDQPARGEIGPELPLGQFIGPVAEGALGIFHDVAVVDQGHAAAMMVQRILDGPPDQALRSLLRDGFHAVRRRLRKTDLGLLELLAEELAELFGILGTERPLDAGIHVLRVLAEHGDVDPLGILHRGIDTIEIAERTHAGIEVQRLAQSHVQRPDTPARRCIERSLQADPILLEGRHRLLRQIRAVFLEGLLAGFHLQPLDRAVSFECLLDGRIHDRPADRRDFLANSVASDERNGDSIGHPQARGGFRNLRHNNY